ncbi:MAG: DUF2946 family protein [Leptothrix ochracea]|uniref:DUF2946 family protein n=2 Tax=Leptothrix ochracea TaxID=735331 RepID=UPI0034E2E977
MSWVRSKYRRVWRVMGWWALALAWVAVLVPTVLPSWHGEGRLGLPMCSMQGRATDLGATPDRSDRLPLDEQHSAEHCLLCLSSPLSVWLPAWTQTLPPISLDPSEIWVAHTTPPEPHRAWVLSPSRAPPSMQI